MELEQKPFALEALAQKMRDLFQKNIEAKGVAFSVEMRDFDAHAWAEAYMDGIGWIPVDFTPGFYYNTYALLRMQNLPGGLCWRFCSRWRYCLLCWNFSGCGTNRKSSGQ